MYGYPDTMTLGGIANPPAQHLTPENKHCT